jgi:hypothetical protein
VTDFDALLEQALRCGLGVLEFWELTPRETVATIEAGIGRLQAERELTMSLAWHTAALTRTKRLPGLAQLLAKLKPKRVVPIERRREEFEEMKARMLRGGQRIGQRIRKGTDRTTD